MKDFLFCKRSISVKFLTPNLPFCTSAVLISCLSKNLIVSIFKELGFSRQRSQALILLLSYRICRVPDCNRQASVWKVETFHTFRWEQFNWKLKPLFTLLLQIASIWFFIQPLATPTWKHCSHLCSSQVQNLAIL